MINSTKDVVKPCQALFESFIENTSGISVGWLNYLSILCIGRPQSLIDLEGVSSESLITCL